MVHEIADQGTRSMGSAAVPEYAQAVNFLRKQPSYVLTFLKKIKPRVAKRTDTPHRIGHSEFKGRIKLIEKAHRTWKRDSSRRHEDFFARAGASDDDLTDEGYSFDDCK
jgi:hypothetical protein